jgi:hypothetical protein
MIRRTWEWPDGDIGLVYMFLSDNEVREVLELYSGMRVEAKEKKEGAVIISGGTLPENARFGVKLR